MVRISKNTKIFIILVIFVLSFVIAAKKTNLLKNKRTSTKSSDLILSEKSFSLSDNYKKIRINFNNISLDSLQNSVKNIFAQNGLKISDEIISENEYFIKTNIPSSKTDLTINKLSKISKKVKIKRTTNSNSSSFIDFETRIKQNKNYLKILQTKLQKSRGIEFTKIKDEQNLTQTEIDRLKQLQLQQIKNKNFDLLLLSAHKTASNQKNVNKVINFLKLSLILIIGISLMFILCWGFVVIILKIMNAMGIKSSKTVSRYGYNYGEYGYSKRKKRVYKKVPEDDK